MSIHSVSLKGKRPSNEDRHMIITNLDKNDKDENQANVNYYGVYDGHGGRFVSSFLHKNLHGFFVDGRVSYPLKKSYVNKAFDCVQKRLEEKYPDKSLSCGSTCLAAVHFRNESSGSDYLNVMNAGDCRGVLCRNNIAYPLTNDHKPHKPEERTRIEQLGGADNIHFDGYDWRINDLSVSRAFGDNESKAYVTHRPDLYKYKITNRDKFMILACDGLWDVMDNQAAVDFVLNKCYDMKGGGQRMENNINASKQLAEHAIEVGSTDNITALVVFFK